MVVNYSFSTIKTYPPTKILKTFEFRNKYLLKMLGLSRYLLDGEIYNGGVLLNKECVLCEPLYVQYQVRRQLCDFEPLQEVLFVSLVLF